MTTSTYFAIHGGLDALKITSQTQNARTMAVTVDTPSAYAGSFVFSGTPDEVRRFGQRIIEQADKAEVAGNLRERGAVLERHERQVAG